MHKKSKELFLSYVLPSLVILIGLFIFAYFFPSLISSPLAIFDYILAALPIFGFVYTIIQIMKTKSVAMQVIKETTFIKSQIKLFKTIGDLATCKTLIEVMITRIDSDRTIDQSSVVRIVGIYSRIFKEDMINDKSEKRIKRSKLECFNPQPRARKYKVSDLNSLRENLYSMLSDISLKHDSDLE